MANATATAERHALRLRYHKKSLSERYCVDMHKESLHSFMTTTKDCCQLV
ncbi:hypothetical protein [Scytonema sp. HK-05]|nr:hypothetical protein [Scytonema sp. HK-05]